MGSETPSQQHVLMVSFPGQGHVNPLLRLAKRLASKGLIITFSTTTNIGKQMFHNSTTTTTTTKIGKGRLQFEFFSDGWDDKPEAYRYALDLYMNQLQTVGRESFIKLVKKQCDSGLPVSCIINNPFLPWVSDVATDLGIPCAVLWVQSCTVFSAYYHYFHNLVPFPTEDELEFPVQLPGLPVLEPDEMPSFLHPLTPHKSLKNAILAQYHNLSKSFCVLVDSFQELEHEALQPVSSMLSSSIRSIGPLFKYPNETDVRADMWDSTVDCIKWLDSQPVASVVYVSFGSVVSVGNREMEEIAYGLLSSGARFLWVVRPQPKELGNDRGRLPEGFAAKYAVGEKGLVVPWCPQEQVLVHPSVACFMTHCGWNSTMESLSCGVPVITVPQWGDQVTNAKFLVDVYGVGVRLIRSEVGLKTLSREDVEKCIVEVTKGDKAEEIKKNAVKWKTAAEEAVAKGGSSDRNVQEFVDDIRRMGCKY